MVTETICRPEVGDKAPSFSLPSQRGGKITLSLLAGKPVVLYFYPKDDTPGCTVEARGFQEAIRAFETKGAVVLGVSGDTVESHCRFAEKYGLDFHLLADTDHGVAEEYGVWVEKMRHGRSSVGIERATFLIDKRGKIAGVWHEVTPEGHAQEVLEALDEL